tara:strand:- start:113 stop:385 length:273 start_codon:yes stop_codon:yes gene_type:complete
MKANNKTYAIISISDLELIDFSEIQETSKNTIRLSLDNSEFVIKWQKQEPTFISDGKVTPLQVLSHAEALQLMATSDWSEPLEEKKEAKK